MDKQHCDKDSDMNSLEKDNDVLGQLLRFAGPRPNAPQDLEVWVRQGVYQEWLRKTRSIRTRRRFTWLAAAAAMIVAIGLTLLILPSPELSGVPVASIEKFTGPVELFPGGNKSTQIRVHGTTTAVLAGYSVETGPLSRIALRLADGSSIRLDHDTRLRLISRTRLALERGAVYVDSNSGGKGESALEVVTAAGIARDIGTQFEVRLIRDSMQVRVREGLVNVDGRQGEYESAAGQQIRIGTDGRATRENISTYGKDWAWVADIAPPFDTDGKPLIELLRWAARETGRELKFVSGKAESAAERTTLHGSMAGFTPETALTAFLATTDLQHQISGAEIEIDFRTPPHN